MTKRLLLFVFIMVSALAFSQNLMLGSTDDERKSQIESWLNLAQENFNQNPIRTIFYLDSAEMLATNYNYENQLLLIYSQKASHFKSRGRIPQIKIYAYKAIELSEKLENDSITTHCKRLLAVALVRNNQFDKAERIIEELMQSAISEDNPKKIAAAFNTKGNLHSHKGEHQLAIDNFNIAKQYFTIAQDESSSININNNIAISYANLGEFDNSEHHFRKVLEYNIERDDRLTIGLSYQNLAQLYTISDQIDSAEIYALKLLNNGFEVGHSVHRINAYQALYQIAKKKGKYEEALGHLEKYTKVNDSLNTLSNDHIVQELEVNFLTREKQEEIDDVQRLLNDIEDKNSRLSTLFILCGIFFLVIISVVFIAYRQQNKLNKMLIQQREAIIEKSETIDGALKEKEVLLKEIHHRVKNNLQIISSLLNLQARSVTDEKALAVLDEGKNRIQAIALIHQKLYQNENFEAVNIGEYIFDLCGQIKRSIDSHNSKLELNINANNVMLDLDTAVPLGLITSELITNSIKHAFNATEIPNVSLIINILEGNRFEMCYEDNGCGLPKDFQIPMEGHLGTEIIEALSEQLEGTLKYGNKESNGAYFKLIFSQIG